jgi:cell division control protein 24
MPAAVAVRVKVYFGEDTFVVVVLDTVLYAELVDKVLKKIRMCGGDRARVEAGSLKLKYQDEDGDRIKITSQEDVAMAFETARSMALERGTAVPYELILHASIEN